MMSDPLSSLGPRVPNGLRLLDLCCGAGGAGMGYWMAGFDVVGVDIVDQPQYPFEFHRADALRFPLDGFDLVHASWPCQAFAGVTDWRGDRGDHPDLLTPGRERMRASGIPWAIENVPEAPLRRDYLLCGTQFGLNVQRHRVFETSWRGSADLVAPCSHHRGLLPFMHKGERAYADAMGCTWMSNKAGRQAIPPAYTHHIGTQFLSYGKPDSTERRTA